MSIILLSEFATNLKVIPSDVTEASSNLTLRLLVLDFNPERNVATP